MPEFEPVVEIRKSIELRDKAFSYLPQSALVKNLSVEVIYDFPVLLEHDEISYMQIGYYPDAEDPGDRLWIKIIDVSPVYTGDTEIKEPEFHGTKRQCWIDPQNGEIDLYIDATGELIDGEFIEDDLFDRQQYRDYDPMIGLSYLRSILQPKDREIAALNESFKMFTRDKLQAMLSAFDKLSS